MVNIYKYKYIYMYICDEYIRADCTAAHTYGTAYVPTGSVGSVGLVG